jgi:calcium-dependent protein kinase
VVKEIFDDAALTIYAKEAAAATEKQQRSLADFDLELKRSLSRLAASPRSSREERAAPEQTGAESEGPKKHSDGLVRFVVDCSSTMPGDQVKVVGSIDALGGWKADRSAVVLQTSAKEFPLWSSGWVTVPTLDFDYKFVVCGAGRHAWEDRTNRRCEASSGPSNQITLSGVFGSIREVMMPSTCTSTSALPCPVTPRIIVSPDLSRPRTPELPAVTQTHQQHAVPRNRIKKQKQHGLRQIASLCHVLSELGEGSSMQLITPMSGGTMRRRVTLSCVAELPEGIAPTKRSLGLLQGGAEDFVRERGCTDTGEAEARDIPRRMSSRTSVQRHGSCSELPLTPRGVAGTGASSVGTPKSCRCVVEATTSDTTSVPESEAVDRCPSEEEDSSGAGSESFSSDERRPSTLSSGQSEGANDLPRVAEVSEESVCAEDCSEDSGESIIVRQPSKDMEEEGGSFDERFELQGKLGEGAYGIVYACRSRKGGRECAMKLVRKDRLLPRDLTNLLGEDGEIRLQSSLPRHPNILGLLAYFDEPQEVHLIMDLCRGGDLFDAIADARRENGAEGRDLALSETAAYNMSRQLLSALAFCHKHGVVHRDVKAENILITKSLQEVPLESGKAEVKLCDFGLAARHWPGSPKLRTPVGSPDYVAPEVARKQPYGSPVDVWSAAVVLFASLRGRLPFAAKTDHDVLLRVREGRPQFDSGWKHISSEARDAVLHLMTLYPAERPSAADALQHSWFVTQAKYLPDNAFMTIPQAAVGG